MLVTTKGRAAASGGRLALLALLALTALPATSCRGVRYGIGAYFRPDADYAGLEEERAAAAVDGARAVEPAPARYWDRYRGPTGDGVYAETELALDWPESGPPELWRVAVGPAYSSIVVADGLAITMEQRRDREFVVAFDARTGDLVWEHSWEARFYEGMSKEGPRGTPVVTGDLVVALGATGEVRALDLTTGELAWSRTFAPEDELVYGLSASPVVVGDAVVVQTSNAVVALDVASGATRWTSLDERMAYATPTLAMILGEETLLISTARRVVGLDPADGTERFEIPWRVSNGLACTQPVVVDANRVLLSAGYGKGAEMFELAGDDVAIDATSLWRTGRFKTRFNEPVRVGDHVFGLDEGTLACIDLTNGKRRWKDGRYGYGQLLLAGDRLVLMDESGVVHVLEVNTERRVELASFEALTSGVMLNVPAIAHGLLYVRSDTELACFDLRGPDM